MQYMQSTKIFLDECQCNIQYVCYFLHVLLVSVVYVFGALDFCIFYTQRTKYPNEMRFCILILASPFVSNESMNRRHIKRTKYLHFV